MHVLFRQSEGLEALDTPRDLGQSPADLLVLSFSDSDLGAFAEGWRARRAHLPGLRLASLAQLTHPLSVDTWIERTASGARAILVRLIGGEAWWRYGLEQLASLARQRGIVLAVLPGDGRPDPALAAASTLPPGPLTRLSRLCEAGGARAAAAALAILAREAGLPCTLPDDDPPALADFGFWHPASGATPEFPAPGQILIPFYRSWLAAADTAGIAALIEAFEARGQPACGIFLPSLRHAGAAHWLGECLPRLAPPAIVNATAFAGAALNAANAPVFQVVHATSTRKTWAGSARGLGPADLAMHIALPEVDGRIHAGLIACRDNAAPDPDLQFARAAHRPVPGRVRAVAARVLATVRPAPLPVALVLSTYPGQAHRMAHAVGLDALASAEAILADLGAAPLPGQLAHGLQQARITWPLAEYLAAFHTLPAPLRETLTTTHGAPEDDPLLTPGGFAFEALRHGPALIALQPERSAGRDRSGEYHDLGRPPCHGYVAFYLWLQQQARALVHIGAHGTLEWLPGKAAALSDACWPEALTGSLPVIYPFIVNDPGEAAQARRRIHALTLGHLPPPMTRAEVPAPLARLERLLDEYSIADGLDPARRDRLIADIRLEARSAGVETDLGIETAAPAEAIPRIDRFLCDLKESQFGAGLHIWGRGTPDGQGGFAGDPASIASERAALIAALRGERVAAGPSGSPFRGRSDVLPTGRNLFGADPRAVPSRAAHAQGVRLAEALILRHLQDHGDYPRGMVVSLWGSACLRTAGEEFAMALHLAGLAPTWDEGSDRVTGYEIVPLARLDRPRIEVTLRVSGLFRDIFADLARLFEAATGALAARDEAADMNPYPAAPPGPRVFAPAPEVYGLGISPGPLTPEARTAAGEAWLAGSDHSAAGVPARAALETRLQGAQSFVQNQDLPETDLLLAGDYASHEAGFAAALARIGAPAPVLYHLDATRPDTPRPRLLSEEIARVIRARATSPAWLAGMMRHGFRGAAEIAATLDHLAAFAHLADVVAPGLFDLYHRATLCDPEISAFLARENPQALLAMEARFRELAEAGLWQSRSNSRLAGVT